PRRRPSRRTSPSPARPPERLGSSTARSQSWSRSPTPPVRAGPGDLADRAARLPSPRPFLPFSVRSSSMRSPAAALVFSLVLAPRAAQAGPTKTFTADAYTAWDKGDAEDAFITSMGEVKPGWTTRAIPLNEVG